MVPRKSSEMFYFEHVQTKTKISVTIAPDERAKPLNRSYSQHKFFTSKKIPRGIQLPVIYYIYSRN